MGYKITTKHGYDFYVMSSMLQKAIRRGNVKDASFAAEELCYAYRNYTWKRLFTCSVEDCYGIITKEIVALKTADDFVNKGKKGDDTNDLFLAKAIILLCMAKKNRDGDYVACNFMVPDRTLTEEELEQYLPTDGEIYQYDEKKQIPDYVFDCHTYIGKMRGKTQIDMIKSEQEALYPHQQGLFDDCDWAELYEHKRKTGELSSKEALQYEEFKSTKIHNY